MSRTLQWRSYAGDNTSDIHFDVSNSITILITRWAFPAVAMIVLAVMFTKLLQR